MEFIILVSLIVLNGVFAMSELAVVSSRKTRLEQMADEGSNGAKTALELVAHPNRFLSTVQIGITLVGIFAGAFGGTAIAEPLAEDLGIDVGLTLGLVVALTTYLSLVIGELVPKRIALQNPERIAAIISRPMGWLSTVAAPLVWFLSISTSTVVRLMRIPPSNEPPVTEPEILSMIREGIDVGVFEPSEEDMVEAVFRLGSQTAAAMLTPRTEITWLDINDSVETIKQTIIEHVYTSYPVCEGHIDNVIGIVLTKDLLVQLLKGEDFDLRDLIKQPLFVPQNVLTSEVVRQIKTSHIHAALIIGEYGGIDGLITVHDLLEEFIGELDIDDPDAVRRADGSWLLDGVLPLYRLQDIFPQITIPEDEESNYDTLGGFVFTRLGHIPKVAEVFEWSGIRFEIMDMDGHRIDKILAQHIPEQTDDEVGAK